MRWPHLFEFMDLAWLPVSLRDTLRDILECGNSAPFRPYYEWVADEVLKAAKINGCKNIVELGAGTAPITRHMAKDPRSDGLLLSPCDLNPDKAAYDSLARQFAGKVEPLYEPVDLSQPRCWPSDTLLFLSASLHHLPDKIRYDVVEHLIKGDQKVMIFEPLRKTFLSGLFVIPSLIPALILPLWFIRRESRVRRFFWCWLLPIAPPMFWWDGLVSCIRQWSEAEWKKVLDNLQGPKKSSISSSLFCQEVSW
jgi:hypothetical protein